MPAEAETIERIEAFAASPLGQVLDFGLAVGGGALVGTYVFPLIQRGLSRHDAAVEGAVIAAATHLFRKWRERREA
jgi:hypothetical protein